jgi:predicted phage terminase large subunit-like protein
MSVHIGGGESDIGEVLGGLSKEDLSNPAILARLERLREIKNELEKERCQGDLVYFVTEVLGYKDLGHEVYEDIAQQFRDRNKEKSYNLILIPRDCMKSSLLTIGLVLLEITKNQNIRILITNAVLDVAKRFLAEIKSHIERNEKFRELFGDLKGDVWSKDEITVKGRTIDKKELTIETGSPAHTKTGKHYDWIIADDLVTRENIKTIESKQGVYKYFQDLQDLLDHPHGVIDVIGTRWDFIDLYSMIMDETKGHILDFNVFWKKAYEGNIDDDACVFNFPWKLNKGVLKRLKRQKTAMEFSAQYLNYPIASEDMPFKPDMFKYYNELPQPYWTFIAVDPATTDKKKSDFSVIIVISVTPDNKWYIRDIVRDKLLPGALSKQILHMAEIYEPKHIAIETLGFQAYVMKDLKAKMAVTGKKYSFSLIDLKPKNRGKEDRIKNLEPKFREGEIFFPKELMYKNTDGLELDMILVMKDELFKTTWSSERASGGDKRDVVDTLAYFQDFVFKPLPGQVDEMFNKTKGLDPFSRFEWYAKEERMKQIRRDKQEDSVFSPVFPDTSLLEELI